MRRDALQGDIEQFYALYERLTDLLESEEEDILDNQALSCPVPPPLSI